jgi:hypothetical protein
MFAAINFFTGVYQYAPLNYCTRFNNIIRIGEWGVGSREWG